MYLHTFGYIVVYSEFFSWMCVYACMYAGLPGRSAPYMGKSTTTTSTY